MAESLKDARHVKAALLDLISKSFQTNLNLIAYLQKSGIELTEDEWQAVLGAESRQIGKQTFLSSDPLLGSLCTDDQQRTRLEDVKSKLERAHSEMRIIKGQLVQFEEIGGTEFLLGEPLASLEAAEELPQKVIDIETQVNKLQTFEHSHLDSMII